MATQMIEPEFDPIARKWFYGGHEANTLQLLLIKLGPRGAFRVANYYPRGCEVRHGPKGVIVTAVVPSTPKDMPIFVAKARPRRSVTIVSKYAVIMDEVLDMWAAGISSQLIAEKATERLRFPVSKINIAAHIVAPAREKGDPRATLRNPKKYKPVYQP